MIKQLIKSYKVELNPTNIQRTIINNNINGSRFVYNWCLEKFKSDYENGVKDYSKYGYINNLTMLKNIDPNLSWLKDVSSVNIQQSIIDFDSSVQGFFKKTSKYPQFKSRRTTKQSYREQNNKDHSIRTQGRKIWIPIVGWVKIKGKPEKYLPSNQIIKRITISRDVDKFFVSILYNDVKLFDDQIEKYRIVRPLGIDLGIKSLAVIAHNHKNNITVIPNHNTTKNYESKLKKENKSLSRKKLGSNNWNKQKTKLGKLHRKIRNVRKDYTHKFTFDITTRTKGCIIMMEDLSTCNMMRNKRLSKALQNASFGEIYRQMDYKSNWNNSRVDLIPRNYPSTKKCSCCGSIKVMRLSDRIYKCNNEKCRLNITPIDRDVNAAINIKDYYYFKNPYIDFEKYKSLA